MFDPTAACPGRLTFFALFLTQQSLQRRAQYDVFVTAAELEPRTSSVFLINFHIRSSWVKEEREIV